MRKPWNNLSMAEKADIMKVAVKHGLTTLADIKAKYNEFAEGGNLYDDGETEPTGQMRRGRYWTDDESILPELIVTPQGNTYVKDEAGNPAKTVGAIRDINPNANIYERVNRELKDNQYRTMPTNEEASAFADAWTEQTAPTVGYLIAAGLKPLDLITPSRYVGLLDSDNKNGFLHLFDEDNRGLFIGNDPTKPFSKQFHDEHPILASIGNMVGDVLLGAGTSKGLNTLYNTGNKAVNNWLTGLEPDILRITKMNANSIPKEEWSRQFHTAYRNGNAEEGQRLWDLWFSMKAKGNKVVDNKGISADSYHTVADEYDPSFTAFDTNIEGFDSSVYTTDNPFMSGTYTSELTSEAERDYIIEQTRQNELRELGRLRNKDDFYKKYLAIYSDAKKARKQILSDHPWLNGPINSERQKRLKVYLQKPVEVDNRGRGWNNINLADLPKDVLAHMKLDMRFGYLSNNYTTRSLEEAQKAVGDYDGAIIRNVVDYGGKKRYGAVEPATVYQVNDPRRVKSAEPFTFDDEGNLIDITERANFGKNDTRYDWAGNNEKNTEETGSLLSKEVTSEISKYANSPKNAVKQMDERMADPDYAEMIHSHSNSEFNVGEVPIYIEGKDRHDWKEMSELFKQVALKATDNPSEQQQYFNEMSIGLFNNSAMALPHSNFVYIPKKNVLLSKSYFNTTQNNAARQHQYSIIKSHDGSHVYAHPKEKSPLSPYVNGLNRNYLTAQNDAELAARGTQLKNYFNKKTISEDELKYAAEHYVIDTGVDNNMTEMFDYLREAAKSDSGIWEKMAEWISKVSPVFVIGSGIAINNLKQDGME
jgi:hypothetical protein